MLDNQTAGVGRQVCWSVIHLGHVRRSFGRSVSWGRYAGMLVGQIAAWVGRQACWSVKQHRYVSRYFGLSVSWGR